MFDRLDLSEWLSVQLSWQQPSLWLVADLLLGLFWLGGLRLLLRRQPITGWLLRCLFIPYVGLLAGGISPTRMGLQDVDWGLSLRAVGLITLPILILLVLIRGVVVVYTPAASALSNINTPTSDTLGLPEWIAYFQIILLSGAWEFHWCFWRAALAELWLTLPMFDQESAYWPLWIAGLGLLPEIAIKERILQARLRGVISLLATTLLFFYTNNFWLCWLLHLAIRLNLAWVDGEESTARPAQQATG